MYPWRVPPAPAPSTFALGLAIVSLVVVGLARIRSQAFVVFRAVLFTVLGLCAWGLYTQAFVAAPQLGWLFIYGHAAMMVGSVALIRPHMKPVAFRILVSWPEAVYGAGTLLGFPIAILAAFGVHPPGWWLSYALAVVGWLQSMSARRDEVDLVVGEVEAIPQLGRHPHGATRVERPLRIAQLTDTHLGPFMSQQRLRGIVERAIASSPDLIVLTGDFLTMESQSDPEVLGGALAPLRDFDGPVVACFGNHDHEAPETVRQALTRAGAQLLVDAACTVDTQAGPVQVIGADFRYRNRQAHLEELLAAHPRQAGRLRLLLLHDPAAFRYVPPGGADLVLSGHTHGGQVGLVSIGIAGTAVSLFTSSPDHGFWAQHDNRLWVHRGTGHYGFPLRLGVPAEESLLRVHQAT